MTTTTTTPENVISRMRFFLFTCLAATVLGLESPAGNGASIQEGSVRADAPGGLCLWYDRPADTWMTEALPIGNGPMGAMLFGGTGVERVQFNEISLWTGDRIHVEGVDDALPPLGWLELEIGHRGARNGGPLAPSELPAVLALEVQEAQCRSTEGGSRGS